MNTSRILNIILAGCLLVMAVMYQRQKSATAAADNTAEMAEQPLKSLFDTTSIAGVEMRNRFIRASVGDVSADNKVNDEMIERYVALAKGGVGTILTGFTLVDGAERGAGIMGMYDDSMIAGNRQLADSVHANGANILMQLVYLGSNYQSKEPRTTPVLSASSMTNPSTGVTSQAMTKEEIKAVVKKFAEAAVRAKKAGFDGVEIHGCHGYLLNQFASPNQNKRTDEYGGSVENRYRLTIEVYEAIREAVGDDFPVWIKLMSQDGQENGVTNEDCMYLVEQLATRGIDAFEVSGNFWDFKGNKAYFEPFAAKVAKATSIPTIVTGGNRDFEEMTRMINETEIGYVGMARPLIEDPELINQLRDENVKTSDKSAQKQLTDNPKSREMKALNPSEIPGNSIDLFGRQWALVTAGTPEFFNMMTISWGEIGQLWGMPVATCFVRPSRHTHQFIEKTKRYTLTFFPQEYRRILGVLGSKSGRDMDKMRDSGLTPVILPTGDIGYAEASLTIVCEVVYASQFSADGFIDRQIIPDNYREGIQDLHTQYIGKIVAAYIK